MEHNDYTEQQLVPVVLEEVPGQATPEAATGGLVHRWRALKENLPPITDPVQKKAGWRIVVFLAVMLVFTLVARGTAAATLAVVQAERISSGEIVQAVGGEATISAASSVAVEAPEGLVPQKMLAAVGQNIKEGDVIAWFDPEEVDEAAARQNIRLKELRLALKKQQQGVVADNSALTSAQTSKNNAQQDYNDIKAAGEAAIAAAQSALDTAKTALQSVKDTFGNLPADAPEEDKAVARQAVEEANAAMEQAQSGLEQAKAQADSGLKAAARALGDADAALETAQKSDAQARQEQVNQAEQNKIDAETTRLDIQKQQKLVEELEQLKADGGELKAPQGGLVTEAANPNALTDGVLLRLADNSAGYQAEMLLPKADAEKIQPGSEAEIAAGGGMYSYTQSSGKVTAIAPPDAQEMVKVTVLLQGSDWKQGQAVQVRVVQSRETYTGCVPVGALHSGSQGHYVYVVRQKTTVLGSENVLEKIPVNVIAKDGSMAAIEGGLVYDDLVVSASSRLVEAGDRVRVAS